MKVCEKCEAEIGGKDGENRCEACENGKRTARNAKAKARRLAMKDVMESLGLTRVVGAMGGVYYE